MLNHSLYSTTNKMPFPSFVELLVSICQSHANNYSDSIPEESTLAVSYVIACFVAGRYEEGVESESALKGLQMRQSMSAKACRELVERWLMMPF